MSKIHTQMSSIMDEVGAVGKNKKNESQTYNYRGIEDVVNMLHPVFAKHKVFILSEIVEERTEERKSSKGANLIYRVLKVKVSYVSGEDGSSLTVTVVGEGMDSGDKAANKAMTAALKYALSQTFVLPYALVDGDQHTAPETTKVETATTKVDKPAETGKPADDKTAPEALLIERMATDGISNIAILKYCRTKGWITENQTMGDLPEALMVAMLKPENWAKVKAVVLAAKPADKPAENKKPVETVKTESTAFPAQLYTCMELSGVSSEELKTYLLGKGYITTNQTIDNLPEKFVSTMCTDANWNKVVDAIKKARK